MAALSCYQPCRSHLAQPARCFDDDEESATLTARRRQFIERCHEARTGRHRDLIPEVSVKRTREELAKHAAQNATLTRRLNVESGWSKVEEVRKKFEGVATSSAYSRSFESPPRRRLADSLFASFKLPRKKDNMAQPRSLMPQQQQKRKSAVELLAESKAFYVKSETVRDRKQELPLRVSSGLSQAIAAGGCHLVSSGALNNDVCCNPYATTRIPSTRRAVSASEGLQNTLRRLLEHSDSRENVYSPAYVSQKMFTEARRLKDSYPEREIPRSQHTSGTFSGTSSSGTSGSKYKSEDKSRPVNFGDARVFFPESFVIPRQRPSEVIIKNAYAILMDNITEAVAGPSGQARKRARSHSSTSSSSSSSSSSSDNKGKRSRRQRRKRSNRVRRSQKNDNMDKLFKEIASPQSSPHQLPDDISPSGDQLDAISPPAEYAHSAPRYIRSNSHSQPSAREDDGTNINSHKSLPDLHAQAHVYPEHVNVVVGTDSIGRSPRRRRHSAHHRTASCSSKGTRSNHSSLMSSCDAFSEHPSPGEENYQSYNSRCGSSFARDSGGSSGHYTQRSAPPHARENINTHPDRNRGYASWQANHGSTLEQCYVSAPPQFQDGAPSPPPPYPPHPHPPHPRVGIHFQASAPPPQFQDEPPLYDYGDYDCTYKTPLKCLNVGRKEYTHTREYTRYHEPNTELISKQPQYQESRMRPRVDDKQEYVNTAQMCPPEEVTSPLGTFKRQRCLRYKQRRPRPILRSKSDISDRYRRTDGRSPASAPCDGEDSPESPSGDSVRLQQFFDYLGMDSRQYDGIIKDGDEDSPVFFSSASTVDSNQLAAAADYTVQGPGVQKQIYRNTEPPSVVERNARIIKWLCQCRKAQMQPPQ